MESYETKRLNYLKEKYGLTEFQLEGKPVKEDKSIDLELEQSKAYKLSKMKLSTGSTVFQGKKIHLFFDLGL